MATKKLYDTAAAPSQAPWSEESQTRFKILSDAANVHPPEEYTREEKNAISTVNKNTKGGLTTLFDVLNDTLYELLQKRKSADLQGELLSLAQREEHAAKGIRGGVDKKRGSYLERDRHAQVSSLYLLDKNAKAKAAKKIAQLLLDNKISQAGNFAQKLMQIETKAGISSRIQEEGQAY